MSSSPLPPPRKKQKTASSDQDGKDAPMLTAAVLTMELIARVASFVPYGSDSMNVCLAVGPKDSAIIRHTCLRNNMKYLTHRLKQYVDDEVDNEQVTTYALAWMTINTDWRKFCTADNREKFASVSVEDEENEEHTIFKVNTLALFNNPLVAIEFNLVDVLKHLVEEVGIDVNAHKWNTYVDSGRRHMLAFAVRQENLSSFKYLIERDEIDVFSSFMHLDDRDNACLDLFQFAFNNERVKNSSFVTILHHASFDPNKPRQEDAGPLGGLRLRPLQSALSFIDRAIQMNNDNRRGGLDYGRMTDRMAEKFKILLATTDADPSLGTADCLSPKDIVSRKLSVSNKEVYEIWYRLYITLNQCRPNLF